MTTPTPKCNPTLTECPRCKNDISKCDGTFLQSTTTPTPSGEIIGYYESDPAYFKMKRDLAAAREAHRLALECANMWAAKIDKAQEARQRAEARAESYKALLIEAQRECHEDNGLMARIDAAIAEGKK